MRCGGTNAGHTIIKDNGEKYIFKQLPVTHGDCISVLSSGSYIDLGILLKELYDNPGKLIIDPYATIIKDVNKKNESILVSSIGSSGSGVGDTIRERVERRGTTVFAKDVEELRDYLVDTVEYLSGLLLRGKNILLEGSQGSGLSLLHSRHYPFCTARDTNVSGFLSEVGVSPVHLGEIFMVIRAYPIRASGNSGELIKEISWGEIGIEPERTSVTNKIRRIGEFDFNTVRRSITLNTPTRIILNFVDYISQEKRKDFIRKIEEGLGVYIDYIGVDNISIQSLRGTK